MRIQDAPPAAEQRRGHEGRRLLTLAALTVLAVQPLLWGCLPRADALFHLQRLAALKRMLDAGHLFPRWLPELGLGYGFPLFNYYAPLGYLPALPWLFLGTKTALVLDMAMAVLALALAAYLLARDRFGAEAGVVAALLAAYAPYTLYDLYQRGALAELWGLAALGFTLWAVQRAAKGEGSAALPAVAYAALMLTHNITALVGTPIVWGFALYCGMEARSWRRTGRLLAALLLGMGLAAFFWVPAFFEKGYVQIENLYAQPRFDFHNHFLTLKALLAPPRPVDPAMVNPPVPIALGRPALLLALAAWLPGGRPLTREERRFRLLTTLTAVAALLMTTPLSRPLWKSLPLLRFLQFPWRFLGEAGLALAVLGGGGAARYLSKGKGGRWLLPLLYLTLALYALPWLFPDCRRVEATLTPATIIRIEAQTGGIGTTAAADYLPRWVRRLPPAESLLPRYEAHPDGRIPRVDRAHLPDGVELLGAEWGLLHDTLHLTATTAFRLVEDRFYFPGWQALLDGEPVEVAPWGEEGRLSVAIPAGEHRLRIRFGETPLRHGADLLSLVSLALLLGLLATGTRTASPVKEPPAPWLPSALHRTLLIAGILVVLKGAVLDHHDTPFAPHRFDGHTIKGVAVPLDLDFGGQMRLLGLDPPPQPLSPDRDTPLALYWAASPPVAADYSVGLYLRDEAGHLYGQDDHQNPAGFPTSELDEQHYIRDVHLLRPFVGTPPGRYRLEVALYDARTGRALTVRQADGRFIGPTVAVADVEVARAERFPRPDELPRERAADLPLGDGLHYLGGSALPERLGEGQPFTLVLYWQAQEAPRQTKRAVLVWLTAEGAPLAAEWWTPGGSAHPPTTWVAGEIVRDEHSFITPIVSRAIKDEGEEAEVELRLMVGGDAGPLAPMQPLGRLLVEAPPRTRELPPLDATCEAEWPSLARLRGYRLDPPQPRAGTPFTLTLYWEAEGRGERPYTVFVHLLRDGRIVAQDDAPPARGDRPTTSWLRGEIIADPHRLIVPADAGPNCFVLSVGFYNPRTFERLHLRNAADAFECPAPLHVAAP